LQTPWRVRISSTGQGLAASLVDATRQLTSAIDAELPGLEK